jgi:hypothetical protein
MSSIPEKDRVSLCRYHFSDHRRCRTPRSPHHRHFCFYHARIESQSRVATELAEDIAYFFSAEYISANDLNVALARIFPAILRGDIKPRTAKTLIYLAQILAQTIPIGQHEYTNAYGGDYWRQTIRNGITENSNRRKKSSQSSTHQDDETALDLASPDEAVSEATASHLASPDEALPEKVAPNETASDPQPQPEPVFPATPRATSYPNADSSAGEGSQLFRTRPNSTTLHLQPL